MRAVYAAAAAPCSFKLVNVTTKHILACQPLQCLKCNL